MKRDGCLVSSAYYDEGNVRNDCHYHNDYELIFVTEGSAEVSIGKKQYHVKDNNLILIANLEQHAFSDIKGYCRYCIQLNASMADEIIVNQDLLSVLRNHPDSFMNCVDLTNKREEILYLLNKIVNCGDDEKYSNEYAACLITELLIIAVRECPELLSTEIDEGIRHRILQIQNYLVRHYSEPLRITDLCRMYYISDSYLSHQYKLMTGYSPKQYLHLLRLKHAAVLLYGSERPIGEIARACGFRDDSNFCKAFKSLYGCSPGEYRKKYGNER